ncbi:MAG TPA: S8 family serine peptidase [Pyrinomonadaceae bacterium]|nr:S8 family serine peptidase [Pyrinomonadaceae bacterium]
MKIFFSFVIIILSLAFLLAGDGQTQGGPHKLIAGEYVAGEVLVKYDTLAAKSSAKSREVVKEELTQAGAEQIRDLDGCWLQVRLQHNLDVATALDSYQKISGVTAVQPNFIYHADATPNDPRFGEQYGPVRIQAPQAWDVTTGSPSVVVAVIDLGVDYNHEDLAANMWRNPGEQGTDGSGNNKAANSIDDDGNGYVDDVFGVDTINHDSDPMDDGGHGTHVAGIIGAVGNNGTGVVGVNWSVRIMAIKSHDISGNGTSASVIEAFGYARKMRNRGINVRVTNSSWGGAPEAPSYDQGLKDAIDAAGNAGILNVCAAGNANNNNDANPFYPATYDSPSIISVAASDASDNKAGFSSYGASTVDIAAPGLGVLSTYRGSYAALSGTSMASPFVAGAAALLVSQNSYLTTPQLKSLLLSSVDPLPASWANTPVLSNGRLNVLKALQNIPTTNQIDDAQFFVRQHYLDFLDRQPDQNGLNYWTGEITRCGSDAICIRNRRIDVSKAFFVEQEFQDTGAFIYRLYGASFARRPSYSEFTVDHNQVIGGSNLEGRKAAFADQFVGRQAYLARYPTNMSTAEYVDALLATANSYSAVTNGNQRTDLINSHNQCLTGINPAACRAVTLRRISDDAVFATALYNPSFVLMQYFGYLRRDPDQNGYDFWLNVLNSGAPSRNMVCSFITSVEYQVRFAPVVTHSNTECGP